MGLRSSDRKLSFDILSNISNSSFDKEDDSVSVYRSNSGSTQTRNNPDSEISSPPKTRKRKKHKKKKPASSGFAMILEDPVLDSDLNNVSGIVFESRTDLNCQSFVSGGSVCTVVASGESGYNCGELRQRNVNGGDDVAEETSSENQQRRSEVVSNGSGAGGVTKLETAESLDWKRLMAEDPNCE